MSLASSAPATERSSTKSHFLTLPAELRNLIYEALFQAGEPKKLRMVSVTNADDPHRESDDIALRSPIPGAVALLLTCRQLNKEAAGYLYSSCTFTVIVDHVRPQDPTDMFDHLTGMMDMWLCSIGEQRTLLSGLDIDLTALILYLDGQWQDFSLDIADMLRHTCGVEKSNQVPIKFSMRWEDYKEKHRSGPYQDPRPLLERLNRLLQIAKTHLPLRTYLRCWRTVSGFYLQVDPPMLQVELRLNDRFSIQFVRVSFDIGEDDQIVRRPLPLATLHRLLENRQIGKRILNSVLKLEETITFDFGKAKISQPLPGLLHASRSLRTRAQVAYLSLNELKFQITADKPQLDLHRFGLLANQQPNAPSTWITNRWGHHSETLLFITFDVPAATAFQDIRIEVHDFIRKALSLQVSHPGGHYLHIQHQATQEERRLNINDIQRRFLAFLYNICVQCNHLHNTKLVSMCMDGEGRMAEAELSNKNGDGNETISTQALAENWVDEENVRCYRSKLRKMFRQESTASLLYDAVHFACQMR